MSPVSQRQWVLELGFPGQIKPQSMSVTTAMYCWKQVFPAITGGDSVRSWKNIHYPSGDGTGTAATHCWAHCSVGQCTICHGRALNRTRRVPSIMLSSAWGSVSLSVIQQSRTNTKCASSYRPWAGRPSLGSCDLGGHKTSWAILQIGKLRPT